MIRRSTADDIGALTLMGRQFFANTGIDDIADFDDASFHRTIEFLDTSGGVCLVAEVDGQVIGAAGALAYPFYFNAAHKTGQEIFWWLDPEHRNGRIGMQLFAALEDWARAAGCRTFSMIALDALDAEKVGKIYTRCGYRAMEHTYIREL